MEPGNSNVGKIIAGLVLVLIVGAAGFYFLGGEKLFIGDSSTPVSEVKKDNLNSSSIPTPELGAKNLPPEVATPVNVVLAPNGAASFRHFEVQAENGKFSPSIIVVNEKDVVDINLKAVDQDYSFSFPTKGIYRKITKGTSGKLNFQVFSVGEFEFSCSDVCSPAVTGKIIVNSQNTTQ
jgi:hypothetical protein